MPAAAPNHRHPFLALRTLLATTALCGTLAGALPAAAQTLPTGGRVVEGQAAIGTPAGGRLDVVQTSPKAVVDWHSFSVGASGHVAFTQPGRDAIILNRVTTPDLPSDIQGRISANGQVWLVNPSGIFIGPGAKIDVAGFLATTHDISNADFMAGRHRFGTGTQPSGTVENEGTITIAEAGLAALVAPHVANRGVIAARLGQVALASGNAFTVDFAGDGLISFAVTAPVSAPVLGRDGKVVPALVENAGQIHADGGRVLLTASAAKGIVERAISMSGVVQARSVTQHADGTIELLGEGAGRVEVSGTLDASAAEAAAKGGQVTVTGETVGLIGQARIDASGPGGGGEVRVGGDYLGGRATPERLAALGVIPARKPVRNAEVVYVSPEASIRADATVSGKGGQVVVWSDDTTRTHGTISARGGREGGDGGFVETSGRVHLTATRAADASAPKGRAGTWLLDPTNVTIGSTTPTDGSSLIAASSVVTALEGGTSVEILTSAGAGAGAGDIVLAVPLTVGTMSGAATLTLTAAATTAGSVLLQEAVTATNGTLSLVLESGTSGDVVFGADVTIAGSLTATAGDAISQTGGTVAAGSINLNATTGVVQAAGATLTTGTPTNQQGQGASGNLALIAGSATLSGTLSAATTLSVTASTGAIVLNAGGTATANAVRMTGAYGGAAITLSGPVTAVGTGGIAVGGTGDVTVGGVLDAQTGPVHLSAFGTGTVSVGAAVSGTDVWIEGGAITVAEEITVSSGASGQIGLVADTLTLDGTIAGGEQGSVTLAPRTVSRSIGVGTGTGDYAVTTAMLGKIAGGGHLVVGLSTSTGTITVDGTEPVGDEGPIGLNFGRATTLRGGTITLEKPVVAPSLALLAGTAITQGEGATITTQGTLVLGRSTGTRPTMTLGSAVSAGGDLWIHADTLTVEAAVSATGRMVVDANGSGALTVSAGGSLAATGETGALWLRAGSGGMDIAGTVSAAGTSGMSLVSAGTMTVAAGGTVEASAGLLHVEGTGTAALTVAGTLSGQGGVAVLLAGGNATTTGTGQIVTPGEFRFDTTGTNVAASLGETGSVTNVSLAGTHLVNAETVASTGVFESWTFEGSTITPWAGDGGIVAKTGDGGASGSNQVAQVTASGNGVYVSMTRSVTALAGQVLSGWVRFVGADYLPYNDDGRFTVAGESTSVLYSKSISQVGNYGVDAWTRVTYVLPAAGTYTLTAEVRNVNDGALASSLQIDDWVLRAAFPTAATAPVAPTTPGVLTTPIVAPTSPPPPPVVVSPPPPPVVSPPPPPVVVSPPPPVVETPVVVSPPPPPVVETPVVVSPPPPPVVETPVVVSPPPPVVEAPVVVSPPPPPPTTEPAVATVVQQVAAVTQQAGPEAPPVQSPQIVVASPPPPPVATVASTTPTGPLVPQAAPPATASTLPAEVRSPAFQAVAAQVASTLTTGNLAGGLQQISNLGLSNVQTQAVFAQVPATQLVTGLAASGSPVLQSVAAPMQSLLSGGGSFAEVRSAIQASGADPTTARTLEVMALAVKKENRTQAFSGAIQQLQTDPNVATTFGTPSGTNPSVPPKIEQVQVTTDPASGQARVVGQLEEVSAFPTLRVNGRWVFVDDQGRFDATVPPLAGTNAVIVAATNEQSSAAVQTFTQQGGSQTGAAGSQRWVQVAADVSDEELRDLAQAAREQAPQVAGKRYAIVIANAAYRDDSVPDLGTPHADAHLVADVLTRRYGFEVDVQLDRTRNEIFDALRALGRKLREEDQVAIYYAGHGYSFYGSDLAYWLPVDAETTRANAWISSADISKLLHRMPARQILLISDSCYSGGFAEAIPEGNRSEDLQALLAARAVMTVTSGGDEPVEDGAGNSPFAKTLADELEGAPSATNMLRLFERIRDRVMADSPQTPNYGVVSFAGYDDGADFVLTQR